MNENIKTGLENLPQVPPPDMVWENIEKKLDEGKRRRMPVWLFYTVSSAASLALLATVWMLFSRIDDDTTAVTKQPPAVVTETLKAPADTNKAVSEGTITAAKKDKPRATNTIVRAEVGMAHADTSAITTTVPFLSIGSATTTLYTTTTHRAEGSLSFAPPKTLYLNAPSLTTQTYSWDFGDVNATAPITYNYTQSGTYDIVVTDENGNSTSQGYEGSDKDDYEELQQPLSQEDMNDYSAFRGNVFKENDKDEDELEKNVELGNVSIPVNGLINSQQSLFGIADTTRNYNEPPSSESYAPLIENEYQNPFKAPLSTFSIDVDNASYSNTRRMIQGGHKPPKDAVRIEEFVNYFDYAYTRPKGEDPFSIHLETASCPWNKDTRVVAIGLQGLDIDRKNLPASNLVFLVDVSGSMEEENKLPLVKKSLKLLVDQMRPQDRIAVVTYAGAAGLALKSTACSEKEIIKDAIDNLDAGGSTAGGEGLMLAYKVAGENLKKEGNNRIILVTDGDFNVGLQSDDEMETLIEQKRKEGIALTVCGFGMGNYKDSKMEILADKGNGNYFYIDNYKESKKVFEKGLTGTLFTIAKDVKIQVEFNPKFVKAYRLIGYENRKMPPQDFNDDTKDAGELGAGHTVTALYEIIPVGSRLEAEGFTELKYQQQELVKPLKDYGDELLTAKLRYKKPDEETSKLLEQTLQSNSQTYENASDNFRYACGVTTFAMLLRESKFKGEATYGLARQLLESSQLNVDNGYREELLQLITTTEGLSQ